jgi:sugar phosphate permease
VKQYRRWFSWGILVFAFVIVFFHRLSIGAVSELLTHDLNLDNIKLANLTAMTFYAYALMQIPVGIFVDTLGVRKLCSAGMFVTAIGSIMLGFSSSVGMAYLSRFLVGLGTSVIIVSIMKVQATLFPARMYSSLSGLTSFFGNLGAFFATFPLAYIAIQWGWRSIFIILGGLTVVLSLLIFIVVDDKSKDKVAGQNPEGADEEKGLSRAFIYKALKSVLTNKATWPNFFAMIFFVGSLTAVLGLWGVNFLARTYGFSTERASYYLSFITYGFIVGAPLVGSIASRLAGHVKSILLTGTIVYATTWVYFLVICSGAPPIGQLPILFFIMGLSIICHILIFTNVKEVNDPQYTGIATAFTNIGEFVGSGLISYAVGVYIQRHAGADISQVSAHVFKNGMMFVLVSALLSVVSVAMMQSHQEVS